MSDEERMSAARVREIAREELEAAERKSALRTRVGAYIDLLSKHEQGIPNRGISDIPGLSIRVGRVPRSIPDRVFDFDNSSLQSSVDLHQSGGSAHESSPTGSGSAADNADASKGTVGEPVGGASVPPGAPSTITAH